MSWVISATFVYQKVVFWLESPGQVFEIWTGVLLKLLCNCMHWRLVMLQLSKHHWLVTQYCTVNWSGPHFRSLFSENTSIPKWSEKSTNLERWTLGIKAFSWRFLLHACSGKQDIESVTIACLWQKKSNYGKVALTKPKKNLVIFSFPISLLQLT